MHACLPPPRARQEGSGWGNKKKTRGESPTDFDYNLEDGFLFSLLHMESLMWPFYFLPYSCSATRVREHARAESNGLCKDASTATATTARHGPSTTATGINDASVQGKPPLPTKCQTFLSFLITFPRAAPTTFYPKLLSIFLLSYRITFVN